jgi:hypothetical protein
MVLPWTSSPLVCFIMRPSDFKLSFKVLALAWKAANSNLDSDDSDTRMLAAAEILALSPWVLLRPVEQQAFKLLWTQAQPGWGVGQGHCPGGTGPKLRVRVDPVTYGDPQTCQSREDTSSETGE